MPPKMAPYTMSTPIPLFELAAKIEITGAEPSPEAPSGAVHSGDYPQIERTFWRMDSNVPAAIADRMEAMSCKVHATL